MEWLASVRLGIQMFFSFIFLLQLNICYETDISAVKPQRFVCFSLLLDVVFLKFNMIHLSMWVFVCDTRSPVGLRKRLISAGLEPVRSRTEKPCIASHYRQFFTNIKIKIKTSFVSLVSNITGFNIQGKLL